MHLDRASRHPNTQEPVRSTRQQLNPHTTKNPCQVVSSSRPSNLLQHNRKNQRQRAQRRRSTARPPNSHASDDQHSKPEHNFHAVENGVRFRTGPFAEAGVVFGQELVGDDD